MHKLLLSAIGFFSFLSVHAQEPVTIPFPHKDYEKWQILEKPTISNDGKWISYEQNPQKGDGKLVITQQGTISPTEIPRGRECQISPNSNFAVFKIKQPEDSVKKAKLAKLKPEKMPKDSLGIWVFAKNSSVKFSEVKSFRMPEEKSDWMVFLHEEREIKADTALKNDSTQKKSEPGEKKKGKGAEKKPGGSDMVIYNPATDFSLTISNVTDYTISKNGRLIGWIKDTMPQKTVFRRVECFDTELKKRYMLFEDTGTIKTIRTDQLGEQLAFIQSSDTAKNKRYSLLYCPCPGKEAVRIDDSLNPEMPDGWCVSEFTSLKFSDNGKRLFFDIAPDPLPEIKDTIPEDEQVKVDVWNWKDPLLQSQQLNQVKDEMKRNYLGIYDTGNRKFIRLATEDLPRVNTGKTGDNRHFLATSDIPYRPLKSWDKTYQDIYLIDSHSGDRKKVAEKQGSTVLMSPGGNYIVWYSLADSSWYAYTEKNDTKTRLTDNSLTRFYDEENDTPDIPGNYGLAGFTKGDSAVIIYDRHDLWLFDLKGKNQPKNLTRTLGNNGKNRYRYVKLDPEQEWIIPSEPILLKSFDENTKESGFYSLDMKTLSITALVSGEYTFSNPVKSKQSDKLIWTKSNFTTFPDLQTSDLNFRAVQKITSLDAQKEQYVWGRVKLISWKSFDGGRMNGLLYTPDNLDTTKKYPVIVYFYEKYSDDLNRFYHPSPSRSTVNFSVYTSNGYIVFVPDITYKTGFPGKSAYDDIISGTQEVCKLPWVDCDRIGIQGQSWGGYQVAWLVTQTDLFKAAMAGAPVSNMTSAYGGIRWESGMSRMFQYEKSQSRIGETLWENPLAYLENSPVFHADQVNTPLLIMHNDADGAVPWYQGIEYFSALRRLGKPSWMLVYNGEEHNLVKWNNRVDLSIRMMQFFDHYLKSSPAPVWMKEGVPAVKKGRMSGFEIPE